MMKARVCLVVATTLVALASCRPDTVDLVYRFDPSVALRYRMVADANAQWDIGGVGEGSYRVVFEVVERVVAVGDEDVEVTVVMTPIEVDEAGLPSPGAATRSFALRLALTGEVLEVLEVDGVEDIDPDERAFIGTYRPPLPDAPVSLSDTWRAEQQLQLASVFQQIAIEGQLEGLRRDDEGKVAELTYSGDGPLLWTTSLPQGAAELTGSARVDTEALLDIERGFLREATSSTEGNFEVRIVREGEERVPITGRLHLDLDVTLEHIGGRAFNDRIEVDL
jgi:hypothetical protein